MAFPRSKPLSKPGPLDFRRHRSDRSTFSTTAGQMAAKARRRREGLESYRFRPALQAPQELPSPRDRHRAVDAAKRVSIIPGLPFWPGASPEQVHDADQPLELLAAAQAPEGFRFRRQRPPTRLGRPAGTQRAIASKPA
jgi:hypothetical protein